tara:strand:- start:306412 stop:306663 length:252 start_codon:yes stop_codon:yes gene_type:complete
MTFKIFVELLIKFFNESVIPLLFALMFFIFLWGIFQYFFIKREDPNARSEGAQFMMWGIIGFAVVISMWGLVRILLKSFGIGI